jgi:leucyl aminopeptidase
MQFIVKTGKPETLATPCLVVGVYEDKLLPPLTEALDSACGKAIRKLLNAGDISGKLGEHLLLQKQDGIRAQRVLLLGCGKGKDLDAKKYQTLLGHAWKALQKYNLGEAALALTTLPAKDTDAGKRAELLARCFMHQQYHYNTTLSKKGKGYQLAAVTVLLEQTGERNTVTRHLATGKAVGHGMNVARELGNLPGNICTPTYLGRQALQLAKRHGKLLQAQVLSEAQMRRLGMHSLLSVGNGSAQDSALIVMQYKGAAASEKPHVLVGKGITFDTGGISLKPGAAMDEMKFDMCGAASVLGVMNALCELKPAINVVGVIASAENMPSGTATKPGDVVTSMSGQTIEILNTDAEGRLVLCDALTYISRFKPKSVIDIATLTGACIVALGSVASGLMSNDDKLADTLYQCGQQALDPVWRLPIWDEYQEQLKSNFADIANIGGPKAGTITAACFLSRFTKDYKWAHLDIAGTAWLQGAQKGATGRPVPLLLQYLLNH